MSFLGTVMQSLVLTAAIILGLLYYVGMFSSVEWTKSTITGMLDLHLLSLPPLELNLVYQPHTGEYKDVYSVIGNVASNLSALGFMGKDLVPFGLYLTDPQSKPPSEWESWGGFLMSAGQIEKLHSNSDNTKLYTYKIDAQEALVTEFPYVNDISILVGLKKAYPALKQYAKEHNLETKEIMEIYNLIGSVIRYVAFLKSPIAANYSHTITKSTPNHSPAPDSEEASVKTEETHKQPTETEAQAAPQAAPAAEATPTEEAPHTHSHTDAPEADAEPQAAEPQAAEPQAAEPQASEATGSAATAAQEAEEASHPQHPDGEEHGTEGAEGGAAAHPEL